MKEWRAPTVPVIPPQTRGLRSPLCVLRVLQRRPELWQKSQSLSPPVPCPLWSLGVSRTTHSHAERNAQVWLQKYDLNQFVEGWSMSEQQRRVKNHNKSNRLWTNNVKEMKARYRSVRNWPSVTPAVSSILQSGCGQVAEYKPLTRKVSRQGRRGLHCWERENPISFTHSKSRMNRAHELKGNTSLLSRGQV